MNEESINVINADIEKLRAELLKNYQPPLTQKVKSISAFIMSKVTGNTIPSLSSQITGKPIKEE